MKLDSVGIEYSSDMINSKTIIHNEITDLESSSNTNESQNSDIIDSLSKEQMEKQLLIADIRDEMTAIETNQKLPEDQRISIEELLSLATENIIETSNYNPNRLQTAIDTIFDSMEGDPANANEIKQGVITLLKAEF